MRLRAFLHTAGYSLVCVLLFLPTAPVRAADSGTQDQVQLKWALVRLTATGDEEVLPFHREIPLLSGQSIKLYFNSQVEQYLYVFLVDSSEMLTVVYPPIADVGKKTEKRKFYVPSGNNWFVLDDNTGLETLYVLASGGPLKKLDELIITHEGKTGRKAVKLRKKLLSMISSLKKKNSRFAAAAEKPIAIAGTVRGTGKSDVDEKAKPVSSPTFYSKTIRIDHR